MTFSELLDLDKTPAKPAPSRQPTEPSQASPNLPTTHATSQGTEVSTVVPPKKKIMVSWHQATVIPRHQATETPAMVRRLRGAVVRLGKEAATHRFTQEEKDDLARIIYEQGRNGLRTCENEIVRIALHWLLEDHRSRRERGVLSRTLRALRR